MITLIKHTEFAALSKNFIETNTAFLIRLLIAIVVFILIILWWMIKLATISISTISSHVELTYCESVRVLKEEIN
jgi:hypothetical protein